MSATLDRAARVRAVVTAGRRLADPRDELGRAARAALPLATGLSPEGVELGLTRHLEVDISDSELACLLARCPSVRRVQVVLSANVFVAALRAIALAAAASPDVIVRPSSREPVVAELLCRALAGGPVGVTQAPSRALALSAGDEVHVYGRQQTIDAIAATCPKDVVLRAHGPGFGVALVDAATADLADAARELSWDVVAFDQRGCLSPRVVFVDGACADSERFALALARELEARAVAVPRGKLQEDELLAQAWYRRTLQVTGSLHESVSSVVGCDVEARALVFPPTGRCIHVARVASHDRLRMLLSPVAASLTCVGASRSARLLSVFRELAPGARFSVLGQMQRPPLDGPVDLRGMV